MKKLRLLAVLVAALLGIVGVAAASDSNRNWTVPLSGDEEVPVRDTRARGVAIFHLSKDGTELRYKLIAANIDNVFMAHIHRAGPGVNGPVVAHLFGTGGAPATDQNGALLAEGTITAADMAGPLAGQPLSALIAAMEAGQTYVNVHTTDGVEPPNSGPGDFPGGEIRGHIH